ncbi:hypothetical protein [Phenylobacterium sp.]|uniref:hypothetical protein n=1 Tax=Phenylobacterium sp. TaxID=1871053 RepID=UPI00286A9E23|nr:hypothetical protein [Phenylobacterium sp.]
MSHHLPSRATLAATLLASVLLGAGAAAAAASAPTLKRTADGHPDFSGVWTNASVTKLTRPPGVAQLTITAAEAQARARSNPMVRNLEADAAPSEVSDRPPSVGDPGGYNGFWLDPGRSYAQVKGEFRTSWIVEPADGQLPFSEAGRERVRQAGAFARRADTPADPEALEPWDRCLIASRGSGGPGMLNNIYNSNYQIVQTPHAVAIVVEMIHDVRTIPLFRGKAAAQAGHGPAVLQPWFGDSTGWWEGDTLVVETLNANAEQGRAGPLFLTPQARVTERFTRAARGEILYEFQVEDATYYARPWRAEMSLTALKDQLFEYACHEGNYALADILHGVRAAEGSARTPR